MRSKQLLTSFPSLAIFTVLAVGTGDDGPADPIPEPAATEPPPPPPVVPLECTAWSGSGQPVDKLDALGGGGVLEAKGRALGFNTDCEAFEGDAEQRGVRCHYTDKSWDFQLLLTRSASAEQAAATGLGDKRPGGVSATQGLWQLSVHARNGDCAAQLLEQTRALAESESQPDVHDLQAALSAAGLTTSTGGCSTRKDEEREAIDCAFTRDQALAGHLVAYQRLQALEPAADIELEDARAFLDLGAAGLEAWLDHTDSAQALLDALAYLEPGL